MLQLLCALVLSIPVDFQNPVPPDAQRVKAAVAELEKAFKDGQSADRSKAIQNNRQVVDADVVRWIARGLSDRDTAVELAAIEALRFMNHPEALKELQSVAQRDGPMRKEPELYAALLKAIGQHGSASSIALLKDDIWSVPDYSVIQARIMSLGRIRTLAAADALIGMMRTGGPLKIQPFMEEFRIALAMLTGVDQGRSQDLWMRWWNDNHDKLKVDAKPPVLDKPLQKRWDAYWNADAREDRQQKRNETGKDGSEKGGGKQ
jgi:hypothetical protein